MGIIDFKYLFNFQEKKKKIERLEGRQYLTKVLAEKFPGLKK